MSVLLDCGWKKDKYNSTDIKISKSANDNRLLACIRTDRLYLLDAELPQNHGLRAIEWQVIDRVTKNHIVDVIIGEENILYILNNGDVYEWRQTRTANKPVGISLFPSQKVLAVHHIGNGFVTISRETCCWKVYVYRNILIESKPVLSFTRPIIENSQEFVTKPIVLNLLAVKGNIHQPSKVAMEMNIFQLLFGGTQPSEALLIAFPDGQICVFPFCWTQTADSKPIKNQERTSKLVCCMGGGVAAIFPLTLKKGGMIVDSICMVGENGRVIILCESVNSSSVRVIEMQISSPVLTCDVVSMSIIHSDGRSVWKSDLVADVDHGCRIESKICKDIGGIVKLKLIPGESNSSVGSLMVAERGRVLYDSFQLVKSDDSHTVLPMKDVLREIEICSNQLEARSSLEGEQRIVLHSLATVSSLLLGGKVKQHFPTRCLVHLHLDSNSQCTLEIHVRNDSPFKLVTSLWNLAVIVTWPRDSLSHETQNQIVKTQPLKTDLKPGDDVVTLIPMAVNGFSNFPLLVSPLLQLQIPKKFCRNSCEDYVDSSSLTIACVELEEVTVDMLHLLESPDRIYDNSSLKQKMWKITGGRENFSQFFQWFLPDQKMNYSCDVSCISSATYSQIMDHLWESSKHALQVFDFETSPVNVSCQGQRVAIKASRKQSLLNIGINTTNVYLLAKLRAAVNHKLKIINDRTNETKREISSVTVAKSCVSHIELAHMINEVQLDGINKKLDRLLQVYYHLRNKISDKLVNI